MSPLSRRAVLRAGVAGTAVGALVRGGVAAAAGARSDIGVSAHPFPLSAVRLSAGSPFAANQARTLAYLDFLDINRLLHMFRVTAGLSSSATPCGGWESPATELRGHTTGHLLTALAQAYASTGATAYRTKGDSMVAVLAQCQARSANAGYLSAFPESFIDRVEARQAVWAPYYTLHKSSAR
jgi:uncharacterized protein